METHYERLSFLDNTFLAMEGPTNPMHVGSTLVFEGGSLVDDSGAVDIATVRAFFDARLDYIPRYRQRLAWVPIEKHPVWVDDEHFQLDYHVRHTALPHPGSEAQLKALSGRIFGQRLDRAKPLWEVWVVEGLEGGKFALISKIHHCMIDGMSGVDLLNVTLSPFPSDEVGEPRPFQPRPAPSGTELLVDEVIRRAKAPFRIARDLRSFVEDTRHVGNEVQKRLAAVAETVRSGWFRNASETPLNEKVGPNRRFDWMVTDLDRVKAVKNATGGTVNDVVIAIVAGGLRRYLMRDGIDLEELDFRAMVPVSTRTDDESGALGNKVTMWLVDLPLADPDPLSRLEKIRATTRHLKATKQALGAATLTQTASWTPSNILGVAARVAAGAARPFNLTVTNVPGPQMPLYLLQSKMIENHPMVPLWVNHNLGIALFSYDGNLDWGLVADWDQVSDLGVVIADLEASLQELEAAASPPAPKQAAPKKPAAKKPAAKKPATKTSTAKSTAAKKPAAKKPAAKKPAAKKPAAKTSTAKSTAAKKPAAKKPAAKKPATKSTRARATSSSSKSSTKATPSKKTSSSSKSTAASKSSSSRSSSSKKS